MGTLWLLVKINYVFQIVEKIIYAGMAIFAVTTVVKYGRDYKNSIDEEEFKGR